MQLWHFFLSYLSTCCSSGRCWHPQKQQEHCSTKAELRPEEGQHFSQPAAVKMQCWKLELCSLLKESCKQGAGKETAGFQKGCYRWMFTASLGGNEGNGQDWLTGDGCLTCCLCKLTVLQLPSSLFCSLPLLPRLFMPYARLSLLGVGYSCWTRLGKQIGFPRRAQADDFSFKETLKQLPFSAVLVICQQLNQVTVLSCCLPGFWRAQLCALHIELNPE